MFSDTEAGVLRLRDWSGLNCRPVYVYDRAYPVAGMVWEGEGTSPSAAWLVRVGSVTATVKNHRATARVGEWMVPPVGQHRCEFSPEAEILSMRFQAGWPDGRPLIGAERGTVLRGEGARGLSRLAKRLERFATKNFTLADTGMEWKRADAVQYLALNRHFLAWLEVFVRLMTDAGCPPSTPTTVDERALQAAHVLNGLPLAGGWNLEWLARQVGLSVAQLNRLFVAGFGTTPKAYHLARRKRAAAHLLREEAVPVKQAALALGFSSACYFTAWFRAQFGAAPRRWLAAQAEPA